MNKKSSKRSRLTLERETVQVLTSKELELVAAGALQKSQNQGCTVGCPHTITEVSCVNSCVSCWP